MSPRWVFAALYLPQGLGWGFLSVAYVIRLTDAGLDRATVAALAGAAGLPWSLKLVMAPLVDRVGSRRGVVIAAQAFMAATLVALGAIAPAEHVAVVAALLVAHNVSAALQDVAVDGLAVRTLDPAHRGSGTAGMWGAKLVGRGIGAVGAAVAARAGWQAACGGMALVVAASSALVTLLPQVSREAAVMPERLRAVVVRVWATGRHGVLVAAVVPLGLALPSVLTTQVLRGDLGMSPTTIAWLQGLVEPAASLAGALLAGALADRAGTARALRLGMMSVVPCWAAIAVASPWWSLFPVATAWVTAQGLVTAFCWTLVLAHFLALADVRSAATHFAAFVTIANVIESLAIAIAGGLADVTTAAGVFVAAAVFQTIAIVILRRTDALRE